MGWPVCLSNMARMQHLWPRFFKIKKKALGMDKIPLTLQYRLSFDLARRPLLCDESDEDKVYSLLI